MREKMELDELTIIVERKGYGSEAWRWRLSNGMRDNEASVRGYSSAEEAYVTGKAHLLLKRSNQAYLGAVAAPRLFA